MTNRREVLRYFDEQKDYVQQRVSEGIERNRKGNAKIRVTDKQRKTIPNTDVVIKQKSHEFRFGANLFVLEEMETREKNEAYKKYFSELFNMATVPFYWDATEPEKGFLRYAKDSPKIYRRPAPDLCVEFCEEHDIEPREHALAYDGTFPKWLYNASVSEVKRELERRFAEIAERYAEKIRTIEVTNEMEWDQGRTAFYDEPDYVEWCFKTAEKYFPKNQLCINDHTPLCWGDKGRATDKYYAYIEANMLKGARIDAIGMQYHLFNRRETEMEDTKLTLNPEKTPQIDNSAASIYGLDFSEELVNVDRYKTVPAEKAYDFLIGEAKWNVDDSLINIEHKLATHDPTSAEYNQLTEERNRILLEQYRIMVETSEKLMDRRQSTSNLYTTLCSALVALVGASFALNNLQIISIVSLLTGIIITCLCVNWKSCLKSYDMNNAGKFAVLNAIEKILPANMFDCEYRYNTKNGIRSYSARERIMPIIFLVFGCIMICLGAGVSIYLLTQSALL